MVAHMVVFASNKLETSSTKNSLFTDKKKKDNGYTEMFYKALENIIKCRRDIKKRFEGSLEALSRGLYAKAYNLSGELLIEMNNIYTALEGIERLLPDSLSRIVSFHCSDYFDRKERYRKFMKLFVKSYERRNYDDIRELLEVGDKEFFSYWFKVIEIAVMEGKTDA